MANVAASADYHIRIRARSMLLSRATSICMQIPAEPVGLTELPSSSSVREIVIDMYATMQPPVATGCVYYKIFISIRSTETQPYCN